MRNDKELIFGMLWQDTDTKDPEKFLKKAVEYYKNKYKKTPEKIHVSPNFEYTMLNEKEKPVKQKLYESIVLVADTTMYDKSLIWITQ